MTSVWRNLIESKGKKTEPRRNQNGGRRKGNLIPWELLIQRSSSCFESGPPFSFLFPPFSSFHFIFRCSFFWSLIRIIEAHIRNWKLLLLQYTSSTSQSRANSISRIWFFPLPSLPSLPLVPLTFLFFSFLFLKKEQGSSWRSTCIARETQKAIRNSMIFFL